jgi:hydroxyacylglutathione hydrolase
MDLNNEKLKAWQLDSSVLICDCRSIDSFSAGFVSGAVFAGHHQLNFNHLARIFPKEMGVVALIERHEEERIIKEQLISAGFTNLLGMIIFNLEDWVGSSGTIDLLIAIEADELAMDIPHDENLMLVDVRESDEYEESHFSGTHSLPLSEMGDPANIAMLPENANLYLYCTDGERSLTAATILKRHGLHNLRVVNANWEILLKTKGLDIEKNKSGKLN